MELVYFKVLVKHLDQVSIETGEIEMQGEEEYFAIALHEIGNWLNVNAHSFESIKIVSREIHRVVDECEYEDLQQENEDLKDQLDRAYDLFDNIQSKVDDLKSSISDIEYFADEIEDESISGQNECNHD